jgi:phage recombination protein Bet
MSTQIEKTDKSEKPMEFIPYGAVDKIRLTIAVVQNFVAIKTKSGKTCSERDAMRFMMLCQAQRLNPFAGDAFLCGYDGKDGPVFSLITAHVAFLKRAESCPDFEGMESGIILLDEDTKVCTDREGDFKLKTEICVGGWARVYRRGRKVTLRRLSVAAMAPAYETPFWSEDKAPGQIVKCAEADALRATFPTLLGGLYSPEETNLAATVVAAIPEDRQISNDGMKQVSAGGVVETKLEPPKKTRTPQEELELLVMEAGFGLPELVKWGGDAGTGNIPDADSLTQISEIPTEVCKRLLKAQAGLLKGLAQVKGGDK